MLGDQSGGLGHPPAQLIHNCLTVSGQLLCTSSQLQFFLKICKQINSLSKRALHIHSTTAAQSSNSGTVFPICALIAMRKSAACSMAAFQVAI